MNLVSGPFIQMKSKNHEFHVRDEDNDAKYDASGHHRGHAVSTSGGVS